MRLILFIAIIVSVGWGSLQTDRSFAQTHPYGVFQGRIVDVNGKIIRGASVTVESANFTRSVRPNPAGHFGTELPPGVYRITVKKSGFATYQLTNVEIRAGGHASHVFQLEPSNRQSAIRALPWYREGDA